MTSRRRANALWAALGAVALVAAAVAVLLANSSGSSTPGASTSKVAYSGPLGTAIDKPVPTDLLRLPLTNQDGQTVDLAAWPGKTVLLVPFLSLCSDVCPMTTGNLLQVQRSLGADRASAQVQIVELTVDPQRDTPARLAAYGKLTGASWQLVTEPPAERDALAKFFGFSYEQVPQDNPPAIDWWTGKPLAYDVDHSDNYFVIDPQHNERVVQDASPSFHGHLNPKLYKFLSDLGRQHLAHAPEPSWTPTNVLEALGAVLHRHLPASPVS
jgi:protein SCO1